MYNKPVKNLHYFSAGKKNNGEKNISSEVKDYKGPKKSGICIWGLCMDLETGKSPMVQGSRRCHPIEHQDHPCCPDGWPCTLSLCPSSTICSVLKWHMNIYDSTSQTAWTFAFLLMKKYFAAWKLPALAYRYLQVPVPQVFIFLTEIYFQESGH